MPVLSPPLRRPPRVRPTLTPFLRMLLPFVFLLSRSFIPLLVSSMSMIFPGERELALFSSESCLDLFYGVSLPAGCPSFPLLITAMRCECFSHGLRIPLTLFLLPCVFSRFFLLVLIRWSDPTPTAIAFLTVSRRSAVFPSSPAAPVEF